MQLFGLDVAGCHCRIFRNANGGRWMLENRNGVTYHNGEYSSASRSNSVAYASQRPTRLTAPLLASM